MALPGVPGCAGGRGGGARVLTVAERAENIAEWVRITGEKLAQQPAQVAPPVRKHGHAQAPAGINAAVRDLGIDRTEAQRIGLTAVRCNEFIPNG